jgi:hypothetical protein
MSTLLGNEVDANDCKCSRDLRLNVPFRNYQAFSWQKPRLVSEVVLPSPFFCKFFQESSVKACVRSSSTLVVQWLRWGLNHGPLDLRSDSCTISLFDPKQIWWKVMYSANLLALWKKHYPFMLTAGEKIHLFHIIFMNRFQWVVINSKVLPAPPSGYV